VNESAGRERSATVVHRVSGGILATVGFILSPLSWWNDLLVNVPLAYAFATVVGLFARDLFVPALLVGYWLTNVVGFVLLVVSGMLTYPSGLLP
jgi:hypothetical protein